jgi:hypothetical protein
VHFLDLRHEGAVEIEEVGVRLDEGNGGDLLLHDIVLPDAGVIDEGTCIVYQYDFLFVFFYL